jgi:hypothetical protein
MLVGVSGYAGSGKDTVGRILSDEYGFTRVAFADKLKELALVLNPRVAEAVAELDGWTEAKKLAYVREYLQLLGSSARDILFSSVWIEAAMRDLDIDANHYVFTDVRFHNEADAIRERGGLVIRVTRPNIAPVNRHISEVALDHYKFDAYIENDGTIRELADRLALYFGLLRATSTEQHFDFW